MGRLLQILGCALMLVATGLAVGRVSRADAGILAPVERAIQEAIEAAAHPTPQPTPTPSPAPSPTPRVRGGGPLTFDFQGSLSIGQTSTASTFGQTGFFTPTPSPSASSTPGPFPFQSSTTQSTDELGAGVTASFSRRTASTLTHVIVPVGFSGTGHSAFGVPQILYSTPKYSLGYGIQELVALGQLQIGNTLRGFTFIMPTRYGQTSFFEGPVEGPNGEQAQLYGALFQEARDHTLYEAGFNEAIGPDTGNAKTLVFGAATAGRNLSFIGEGAWQTRSNGDGDPHGVALQVRLDDFAQGGECSTTLRSVPDQFVAYGAGEIYGDRYADFNCHDSRSPLFFDANWERTGDELQGINVQSIATIGYSPVMRFGGVSFTFTRQDGNSSDTQVWSNTGTASLQTQFLHTTILLGAQFQHSLLGTAQGTNTSFLANLNKQITHHLTVGVSGQITRQNNLVLPTPNASATPGPPPINAPSLTLQKGLAFNISESFRRTSVQLSETVTRTISDASDAIQQTPLVTLTRQISPGISVATSLGYQVLHDSLNPSADGRSKVFSIAFTAPFNYGNTNVTGRVDPHLPATIVGKVLFASTATGVGASANVATFTGTGGIGNVLVTLDGRYVERTDLTGGFQFSFIPPGQHQLTIDTSSMPRGFTASNPVQNITLQGGQTANVSFTLGTFGGVLGHVYGVDPNGNPMPLSNVQLRVDGGAYALTDKNGAYGFGGLSAGQHEITVIPQSVPATADFSADALKQTVSVSDGRYTTADFHAQLLGSIAGTIVYAKEMVGQAGGPVLNAYVVAEPGEHAAIDQDDGTFIIDNLAPGDYTVSVDPETILSGLGAAPENVTVHLAPGEHYSGLRFEVGQFEKKVVFSLLSGGAQPSNLPASVHLSEAKLPPRGTATVTINAPESAGGVEATAFGKHIALTYDKGSGKWTGEIEVPENTPAGSYPVTGSVAGTSPPAAATLVVDPKLPLVTLQILTPHSYVGETVLIRARFLVDVRAGDKITWQDGEQTVLGKPVSGRVFTFQKTLTLLPLHGALLTARGPVPIEVL
jgi:hypothetical protein